MLNLFCLTDIWVTWAFPSQLFDSQESDPKLILFLYAIKKLFQTCQRDLVSQEKASTSINELKRWRMIWYRELFWPGFWTISLFQKVEKFSKESERKFHKVLSKILFEAYKTTNQIHKEKLNKTYKLNYFSRSSKRKKDEH